MERNKKQQTPFRFGSGVGLDTLYLHHKDAMYRVALSALDGDSEKALAVVKQAFKTVSRHLPQIENENSKRTKALMIAAVKSALNNMYQETRLRMGIPDRYENPRATQRDILRINQVLVRNELVANLAQYAERLTFQERELVFYTYFAKWSEAEIAKHMGFSAHEVGPRLFRARQKIARLMADGTLE